MFKGKDKKTFVKNLLLRGHGSVQIEVTIFFHRIISPLNIIQINSIHVPCYLTLTTAQKRTIS